VTRALAISPKHPKSETHHNPKEDGPKEQAHVQTTNVKPKNSVTLRNTLSRTKLQVLLEHIIPGSIHARLKESPNQCVASLVKDPLERCRYPAKGQLTVADQVFRYLSEHISENEYAANLEHIGRLAEAASCGNHRRTAGPRLVELRKLVPVLAQATAEQYSEISSWLKTISTPGVPHTTQQHETRSNPKPTTTESSSTKETPSPPAKNTSPTNVRLSYALAFTPYQPKHQAHMSIQSALLSVITTPLKPTDLKPGYIYIFWDLEHFGMAKIGFTKDLKARLQQWNTKCKRTHSYHGELAQIPHVSRIERLMHIELKEYRMQRRCEGCPATHREWFNVGEMQAVRVFRKWQEWIEMEPYKLDKKSGEWRIRDEMLDTLDRVCEPVPIHEEARQRVPRRRSGGVKGAPKKGRARHVV